MAAKKKKRVLRTAEIVALAAILAAILFVVYLLFGQMRTARSNEYSPYRTESAAETSETVETEQKEITYDIVSDTDETVTSKQTDENPKISENNVQIQSDEQEVSEENAVDTQISENDVQIQSETDKTAVFDGNVQNTPALQTEATEDAVPVPEDASTEETIDLTDESEKENQAAKDSVTAFIEKEPAAGEAGFADGVPLLEVHFLDVDRNDAILIRCGDESAFIDCGAKEYGPRCVSYMRERGIDHLKYYIGTHAHADHVGGAGAILAAIETDLVLVNYDLTIRCMKDIAVLPEEDEALEKATYQTVSVGDEFTVGGAKLTCIGPVNLKKLTRWHDSAENTNSLVFRLTYGEISFLLTADADTPSFYQILKNDPDALKCTVFRNPHHNGKAGDLVVKALEAEYIVIQTSTDHPPVNDYVKTLRKKGICPLIVSKNNAGTTAFFTDGQTLRYTTEHRMGDWSLSRTELTLKKGEQKGVARNMASKNIIDTLMWSTSDETVAYPDPNYGTVCAVSSGTCVITATAFDGTERSISVTVR